MRDAEQEKCWKGGIHEWRDAGKEGRRNGGFRIAGMVNKKDSGMEG